MRYTISSDTSNILVGVELDYVIDDFTVGREVTFMGEKYTLQQGGSVLVLANHDRVLTLVLVEEKVPEPSLVVNETLEISLKDKTITVGCKTTYKKLYDAVVNEWKFIQAMSGTACPATYDDNLELLTLSDAWDIHGFDNISGGGFTRVNSEGRSI